MSSKWKYLAKSYESGAIGKIQFSYNTFGYGNLRISGTDVQSRPRKYYEPGYLAMAGQGLFQKAAGQKQL